MCVCVFAGKAVTQISHDAEDDSPITSCLSPDCFKKDLAYKAPLEQMEALIDLSESCEQDIIVRDIKNWTWKYT